MPDMAGHLVPAVLLTQGGGHGHVLSVGVSIGPLVLRVALLLAVPVVAGFVLMRGFLTEPGRRELAAVIGFAGGAAVLELMLSDGLNLSERVVPVLLLLLAVPLYLALSRDPRFAPAVGRTRRLAPWIFWPAAVLAGAQFALAWFAGGGSADTVTLLHTGVVLALVALAWFVVAAPRRTAGRMAARLGAAVLAAALIAGAGQVTVLRPAEPVQAQDGR